MSDNKMHASTTEKVLTAIYHGVNFGTLIMTSYLVHRLTMSQKSENMTNGISSLNRCADYMISDSDVNFSGRAWVYVSFAFSIFFVLPFIVQALVNWYDHKAGNNTSKQSWWTKMLYGLIGVHGNTADISMSRGVRRNAVMNNYMMMYVFLTTSILALRSLRSINCADGSAWDGDNLDTNYKYFKNPNQFRENDCTNCASFLASPPDKASTEYKWFSAYFAYQFFTSIFVILLMTYDIYENEYVSHYAEKVVGAYEKIKTKKGGDDYAPQLEAGLDTGNKFKF